jgi:hypothetical protein
MIRKAVISDIDNLREIILEFIDKGWKEYNFKIGSRFEETIKNIIKDKFMFISIKNNKIIGLICGVIGKSMFHDNQLITQEVLWYVSKKYITGLNTIGYKLLKEFEKEAIKRNSSFISMTHIGNLNVDYMNKMYLKKGYRVLETQYIKEV